MVWLLRRCENCGTYTLDTLLCPKCQNKVKIPHPPKFSPDDKYLMYRIAARKECGDT